VIAIITHAPQERAALEAVCRERNWTALGCDSVRSFRRLLGRATPKVVLTRGRLADGYGDKVLSLAPPAARKVVLLAAGTSPSIEARIVSLGADCVLRDPIRVNVLREYIAKYMIAATHAPSRSTARKTFCLAGMNVDAVKRQIQGKNGSVPLTPRELELAQLLVEAEGEVVTYEFLFEEILRRTFTGDTCNMRVLLGKLITSGESAGGDIRKWIHVIPKTGYRYNDDGDDPIPPLRARSLKRRKETPVAPMEVPAGGIPGDAETIIAKHVTEKLR